MYEENDSLNSSREPICWKDKVFECEGESITLHAVLLKIFGVDALNTTAYLINLELSTTLIFGILKEP